jgi:hypothetical protein
LHRNLTPDMRNKFLKGVLGAAVILASASTVAAQNTDLSNYQGPGILSRGVGDLGSRSGEQLDLRYYGGVSGVMDTNLALFATDAKGNLIRIHNLYGIEAEGGVYGVHSWKRSQLGLDYKGTYHRYINQDTFRGSDQSLTLGYTHQSSQHLVLDLRESVTSLTLGSSQVADAASSDPNSTFTPALLLFDSRTNFLQSSAFVTWTQSARMSYSAGGAGFLTDHRAQSQWNSWGYDVTGSAMRRLSKSTSVGATYVHSHFEFPKGFSRSDSNAYQGVYATGIGRFWTFTLEAGATVTEVENPFTFALDPITATLLGQSTITGRAYKRTIYPSGLGSLKRRFRSATLGFNYTRGLNSGNGAYATSRLENAFMSLSYNGIRKLNLGVDGGYYRLTAIGQNLGLSAQYSASAGFTYNLGHAIHLSARYDLREQQIDAANYRRTSSRAQIGFLFSPGSLPLSLW